MVSGMNQQEALKRLWREKDWSRERSLWPAYFERFSIMLSVRCVRKLSRANVDLDPVTQVPKGFTGKITFSEPGKSGEDADLRSVDSLLSLANDALSIAGFSAWVL